MKTLNSSDLRHLSVNQTVAYFAIVRGTGTDEQKDKDLEAFHKIVVAKQVLEAEEREETYRLVQAMDRPENCVVDMLEELERSRDTLKLTIARAQCKLRKVENVLVTMTKVANDHFGPFDLPKKLVLLIQKKLDADEKAKEEAKKKKPDRLDLVLHVGPRPAILQHQPLVPQPMA